MDLPDWNTARHRVAALARVVTADDPRMLAARRDMLLGRVAARVREAVADLPDDATNAELDEVARLVYRDRW